MNNVATRNGMIVDDFVCTYIPVPFFSFFIFSERLFMAMPVYHMAYDPLSTNSPYNNSLQEPPSSGSMGKFPHTRAQLSAIARQYKPQDSYDSDAEADEYNRVPQSIVNEVVSLLVDEREDELKTLLKTNYVMDDESVCCGFFMGCCCTLTGSLGRAERAGPDAQASRRYRWRAVPLLNSDAPPHFEAIVPRIHKFVSTISCSSRYSFVCAAFTARQRIPQTPYSSYISTGAHGFHKIGLLAVFITSPCLRADSIYCVAARIAPLIPSSPECKSQ
jgi:hypothetical protein